MAGVNISIGADSKKAQKELSSFQKKTKSIAASISKGFSERIGHKMFEGLARAAAGVPEMMMSSINAASDLNEELGKSTAIFGDHASQLKSWSETTADAFGISRVMALEATGTIGNMLSAFNITGGEAAKMSQELVELAADMGSFNNASIEDTIFAIGAALRGENEPIRKYGVALDDARLKAQALEMGLYSGKGTLDANSKAMASYALILKQTSIQQGNFAETADDLANSKKRLQAKFEDLKAVVGEALLPVVKEFVTTMQEADFDAIASSIASLAGSFASLTDGLAKAHQGWVWFKEDLENFNFTESLRDLFGMTDGDDLAFSSASSDPDAWKNIPKDAERQKALEQEQKEREAVDKSNADFRQKLQEEEDREKRIRAAKDEKERRKGIVDRVRDEYKNTLKVLDARIKGDKDFLDQEKLRKEVAEEQKKSVFEGVSLDEKSAMKIVLKKREAEEAERKRQSDKEALNQAAEKAKKAKEEEFSSAENDYLNSMSRGSNVAVSSLQRVGGGGGVYGELDLQRRQTDLQTQMVTLLSELKQSANASPISDF